MRTQLRRKTSSAPGAPGDPPGAPRASRGIPGHHRAPCGDQADPGPVNLSELACRHSSAEKPPQLPEPPETPPGGPRASRGIPGNHRAPCGDQAGPGQGAHWHAPGGGGPDRGSNCGGVGSTSLAGPTTSSRGGPIKGFPLFLAQPGGPSGGRLRTTTLEGPKTSLSWGPPPGHPNVRPAQGL